MSDQTTNLGLPFLMPAQAQKHVTVNESLLRLDALAQASAQSRTLLVQPGAPSDGQVWILPAGKTGAEWGGYANHALAYYRDGAWEQIQPKAGWTAYLADEGLSVVFDGVAWAPALADVDDFVSAPTLASLNGGALAGLRNGLINGCFRVWQRGSSFPVTTSAYTADRWVASAQLNGAGAATVSRQAFTPGAPLGAGNGEPEYFLRYDQTTGTASGQPSLVQRMENVRTFAGDQVAISAWLKADTSRTVHVYVNQSFGSGGSSAVTTLAGTFAVTASWQKFSTVVTVPSVAGKTIGTSSFVTVSLWFPAASTFTVDIARVQIEPGGEATPFEPRPIAFEEALCRRYYERQGGAGYGIFGQGFADTTTQARVTVLCAPKRIVPTVASGGVFQLLKQANTAMATTSISFAAFSPTNGVQATPIVASGLVAGEGVILRANNDAAAYIDFNAEL